MNVEHFTALPLARIEDFGVDDVITLILLAAFFLFLGIGAIRLRRIRNTGLEGHAHRRLQIEEWELVWPDWWPSPEETKEDSAYLAGPLDHDGRLLLLPLRESSNPEQAWSLRGFLESRLLILDDYEEEEAQGVHGTIEIVEGRAQVQVTERGYVWAAHVPGVRPDQRLVLLYRASVLYGLADGFWLHEVAARARLRDSD